MVPAVKAEYLEDRKVSQQTRFRVESNVSGNDVVGVGDLVFVRQGSICPIGTPGFIRELGADGFGMLIVRIDLIKADPMSWPTREVWVYPYYLVKAFTEKWAVGG